MKIMKYEVYQDEKGEFRFRLVSGNNEVIATGEGYKNKADCLNAIDRIKESSAAPVVFV